MRIPEDIHRYVRKNYTKKIAACALTEAAIITYLCLYGKRTFSAFDSFSYVAIHVLLILLPLFYFKIPSLILDRSWRGTVTRVNVTTCVDNIYPYLNNWLGQYHKNNVFLYVDDGSGKITRKMAYSGKARYEKFINTYQPGDVVTHIAGTKYVQIMPKKAADPVICVVCSAIGTTEQDKCKSCGHTLQIK